MRFRTWPVAAAAFAGLLLLIVISIEASSRLVADIYSESERLNVYHHQVDAGLRRLRSDIHLSSIFIRDYLLDVESEHATEYRGRIADFRTTSRDKILELRALAVEYDEQIRGLEARLDEYWKSFDPLLQWTPSEKIRESGAFLRREVVPKREAVLEIAYEIERLNEATLATERSEIAQRQRTFRDSQRRLFWECIAVGLIVSVAGVMRLRNLERRTEKARAAAQEAEEQMRKLSQQVVAAHEEERKRLSRELHDQVAQMLTALRMELSRIDRHRPKSDIKLGGLVSESLEIVDSMVRSIRDIALGLRPSMLDDFGLGPALEWHVRDFASRCGLDVRLNLTGNLDQLPDQHRTCVYRVVQEALTNCARHADARTVTITADLRGTSLCVSVVDNGSGFDLARRGMGFGLRGMEQRVKELNGSMSIESEYGVGTSLKFELPVPGTSEEASRATIAS